ncbi:MAG: 16S rRNA (guanine(527)-N(7))-methyltransferase RsmG [Steroidobacteraceae bacterium]
MNERDQLIAGARALGLTLTEEQTARLLRLIDELARWNRAYNLTAITDRGRMLTHHLLDSLSVHADLHGATVVDVGTGAGFPGLPLAVVTPQRAFTLVDSGGKKTRFAAHAARVLDLGNVMVVHARAESLRPVQPFDTVVARAFAPLPDLLDKIAALCGPDTRVLAMKGKASPEELESIDPSWRIVETRSLAVPGVGEARTVVVLRRPQT